VAVPRLSSATRQRYVRCCVGKYRAYAFKI